MPKVTLVFFEGCPGVPRAREAILKAGISSFQEINQEDLPKEHPLRTLASPTVLFDDEIVLGANLGAPACSIVDWSQAINVLKSRF